MCNNYVRLVYVFSNEEDGEFYIEDDPEFDDEIDEEFEKFLLEQEALQNLQK